MKSSHERGAGGGGFTLVELLVVIFAVAVLVAVVGYQACACSQDEGNIAAAKAQIKQFDTALVVYKQRFDRYPESLEALVKPPSGASILAPKKIPLDPWDTPYQYELAGSGKFIIICLGADAAPGGEDEDADIRSDDIQSD